MKVTPVQCKFSLICLHKAWCYVSVDCAGLILTHVFVGTYTYVFVCVLGPYGRQVGWSRNSPLCGDLAAYRLLPLLPFRSLRAPAWMMWRHTRGVA